MTITEKKPLLIQIPGERTPNELPMTASAVGYDFVQGNYLIYSTGSDSWVTAPPNGAATVVTTSLFRLQLLDYEAVSSPVSTIVGQVIFPANEFTGSLTLRGVVSSDNALATGSVQLYNVTSGAYVDIGGPGIKHLSVTGTVQTVIQSVNLISASNFNSSSQAVYDLIVSSSNGYTSFFGGFELRPEGSFSGGGSTVVGTNYWQSTVNNNIFTTGSIAVTGSITGSNLILNAPASRILAPNGALVISSSAGTFITGSLVVSGTRSPIGTETTSVLFNGDIFVSGGIGLNDYLQLKPVGALRIPTNATASYLYTSGSEDGLQDLYFAQYGGPYTNITRLRWLEGSLSTGLLHGGLLSTQNGTTTFSITSGSGIIVKYNSSLNTDPYPTIALVQWPAYVSQSLTNSGSAQITYVGINISGTLLQQVTPFVDADYQEYISIGRVLHQSGSVTNGTITSPIVAYGAPTWTSIFTRAIGPLKTTGHVLAASGSTLSLTKTAGNSYVEGRNYSTNTDSPNSILASTDTAVTVSKIFREYVSGSTPIIDSGVANAGYTVIDPTRYNLNGTLTAVDPNKVSIQRVYWFPNSVNRAFFVYYGPKQYGTLDLAQAAIAEEEFIEGANTAGAAILVAYILVERGCTNLLDTTKARILQAGPFRGSAAGGGSVAGTTNPGGADTYVQFNDAGAFGGVAGLTFNKTSNTLTTTNLAVSNIATVSGSVILGDAASDVVYISGSVTASNGLQVTGSFKATGTGTDGTISVPGYGTGNLVGSAFFDDTVTNGGTYGTIIRSQAGDLAYATLTFVQDNTYAGALAGLINTPSTPLGYRGGLNISAPQGKVINFRFNSNPTLSVGNFNANGLEVTGSVNISNGAYVNGGNAYINAGGLKIVGSLTDGTSIGSYQTKGTIIADDTITDGSSYGVIIRNQSAADVAYANLSFVQNNQINGQITGLNNTPTGINYGVLGGINIAALTNKVINFRAVDLGTPANSYSFGKFSSTGLDVTGVVTASLGFSGSLTKLTDGTSYIIAGNGISVSSASNGAITISSSVSGGTPGGTNTQIQYNNSGSFGGVTNLTWNGSTLYATGSFKGNLDGTASYATNAATASYVLNAVTASYATVAVSLTTNVFNVALNGTALGVSTNIGGIYIPATTTVTTKSLAYIGGSTGSEVAVLKLVPINSVTVSASWVVTGTLSSVSLSSPVTLGRGWYDLTLETGTVSQTAFGRGLYLTSGDI